MEQEKYIFTYTKEEMKAINDTICHPIIQRSGLFSGIMGVFLILSIVAQLHAAVIGMFAGIFTIYLIMLISSFRQKELRLQGAMKVAGRQYETTVTSEKVIVQVKIGEEEGSRYVFPLQEIKSVGETATICVLQCNGIAFYIRKEMLMENSLLRRFVSLKKKEDSTTSRLLFFFSLVTIPVATGISAHVSSLAGTELPQSMWVFFCFLPFSLASLIYGIVKRSKKNIIAGCIITLLLIVWGCFCFIPFNY